MSETASTGTEGTQETETAAPATESTSTTEATTVEQLPQFAQDLIRNLRNENAAARVKTNEKVTATKAETQSEFEAKLAESNTAHQATQAELATANLNLAKLNAAIEGGVPTEKILSVASRLNGTTIEEIKADVEEVKKLFGVGEPTPRTPVVDPSQGKTGSGAPVDGFTSFMQGLFEQR